MSSLHQVEYLANDLIIKHKSYRFIYYNWYFICANMRRVIGADQSTRKHFFGVGNREWPTLFINLLLFF